MTPLRYAGTKDAGEAVRLIGSGAAAYLGGGTNLIDLMREGIVTPDLVVDVSRLNSAIESNAKGELLIGGAVQNSQLAEHAFVRARYPVLSRAILAGASPQIRNMATVAGNLLQRTRCAYFYDVEGARCNKRVPGQGCDALQGFNRNHAILGVTDTCVATHPSDMAVAMMALDAELIVQGPDGIRTVPLAGLYNRDRDTPHVETVLQRDELVTSIKLPALKQTVRSEYCKVRDRSSYAFALISVAAVVEMRDGRFSDVRIALGGVAPMPWRTSTVEAMLTGRVPSIDLIEAAAQAEFVSARPLRGNAFKIPLAIKAMAAVISDLADIGNGGATTDP